MYPDKVSEMIKCNGELSEPFVPTAKGRAVNFDCGCFISFSMFIESGTIRRIRQSTNGCGFMLAAAKILSDDHTEQELTGIGGGTGSALFDSISESISQIPAGRESCCMAAIGAFQNGLWAHREQIVSEFHGDSPLVCTCFGVTEATITSIIESNVDTDVSDITRICRAGGGCGSCTLLIQEYIDMRELGERQ